MNAVRADKMEFGVSGLYPSRNLYSNKYLDTNGVTNFYFQILFKLFVQQNGAFKEMFKTPQIDWCKMMRGLERTNGLIKIILEELKKIIQEFFIGALIMVPMMSASLFQRKYST
jgi:hypothetical protein